MRREHDVCLSILFAARHTSRQSTYQARLLFGLETRPMWNGCAPRCYADLQQLACTPGRARVRVPRAALVLARAVHGDAPGAAPPAHADGAPARHRARLAASAGRRNRPPEAAAPFVAPRVAALTIAALGARAPRAGNHGRVSHQGSSEGLSQRRRGAEGHRPHRARRRFFRATRAERRRQDHGHRHRHVADSQVRRLCDGVRPRSRARARGGESLHRRRAARDQLEHVRAQRSHARQPGRLLRRPARRRAGARPKSI